MARKSRIFWTKNREQELKLEVTRYNDRLRYALKHADEDLKAILPEKASYRELRRNIRSLKQLNATMKRLRMARAKTLKPNKTGTNTIYGTKARLSSKKRKTAEIEVDKRKEALRDIAKEIDTSKKGGRLPTERDFIIKEIGISEGNEKNIDKIFDWLSDTSRTNRLEGWRNNYLDTIAANMEISLLNGDVETYEMLQELYKKISSLPIEQFALGQLSNPAELAIGQYISSPKGGRFDTIQNEERKGYIERLIEAWGPYLGGTV